MKKVGAILLTIIPSGVMIGIQLFCITGVSLFITALVSSQMKSQNIMEIMRFSEEIFLQYEMAIYSMTQLCTILIFSLWFYLGKAKFQLTQKGTLRNKRVWMGSISICVGMYLVTFLYMLVAEWLAPNQMLEYAKVMQELEVEELKNFTVLNVLILAPIGEELIFRGITMFYAKKISSHFWVANLLQAFLFGWIHGNIIQGIYAFALGLVLGYLSHTYGSIYLSIILHFIYNFFGTVVAEWLEGIPIFPTSLVVVMILAVFLLYYGVAQLRK